MREIVDDINWKNTETPNRSMDQKLELGFITVRKFKSQEVSTD